jgi:vitamin B12 transporter
MRSPSASGAENARGQKTRRSCLLLSNRTALVLRASNASLLALIACAGVALASEPAPAEPPVIEAPEYETVVRPVRDPAVPREDLTASASVITADRTPRSGETLPKLLSELPGAAVTRYGSYGSLSTLSLRGSPPNQVAVYVDGVPLAGALTGTVDLGLVPSTLTQRIEVYRGQSPLPFGSSAMGGVVSITSETPAVSGIELETGGGSFQTRHAGGSAALVRPGGSLVARLNLFRSQADFPYRSDNGTLFDPRDDQTLRRQNNDLEQIDGSLRATLAAGAGRQLWLSLSALQREQGLPARGILQSYATRLGRRRLALSANFEAANGFGEGSRLRATVYALGSQQRLRDPLGEITLVNTSTRDHSLTAGATTFGSRPIGSGGLVLSALLDARHEGYFPKDLVHEPQRLPGRREFGAAAVTATQWFQRPQLELLASVRGELAHDEIEVSGQPGAATRPETYLQPIFRVGATQTPHPAVRLRANAGRYARLPTLFERYGNAGNIKGNADLVPESGLNADLGVTWRPSGETTGGLALLPVLDAAVFAANSRNLIHFDQKGYFAGYENVARARSLGAELSLDLQAVRVVHLYLKGTAIDARDRSGEAAHDGRRLPHLPHLRGYLRPELRDLPLGNRFALGLYGELESTSRRFQDRNNEQPQPGRTILGAGASIAYRPAQLRAVFSAYNLGNQLAPDVLDFPTPGRSFFLTLQFAHSQQESYR